MCANFEKGSSHKHAYFNGDLYHKDVYMPSQLTKIVRKMIKQFKNENSIVLDNHLSKNIGCDKCHEFDTTDLINTINSINPDTVKIIEIGTAKSLRHITFNDNVLKFMVRIPYDGTKDAVIVFSNTGRIKTAWLNDNTDDHQHTLNRSRYVQPPKSK